MNDKKKESLGEKIKEGISMQEIESFARKYMTEVFLILSIVIASISSMFDFFTSAGWSVFFAGLGAIFSIAFPSKVAYLQNKFKLLFKQTKATQVAIGIVRIIIALFLPFIIFAIVGMFSGSTYHKLMKEAGEAKTPPKE